MGCGELDAGSIATVVDAGLAELHFAAPKDTPSPMRWRNPAVGMGAADVSREYRLTVTDPGQVGATIAAARGAQ
jgi:hypothetical protein